MYPPRRAVAPLALILGLLLVGAEHAGAQTLTLRIDAPRPDEPVGQRTGHALVLGRASTAADAQQALDLAFLIDTSESTARLSGADVDADGRHGRGLLRSLAGLGSDAADSILAAEIAAVRALLSQLDPVTTRVALVSFNDSAYVELGLTHDFDEAHDALQAILEGGPTGMTDMRAALLRGTELLGTASAVSVPRRAARRQMLLLTDGSPTRPYQAGLFGFNLDRNIGAALEAARTAAAHDIRVLSFAIGKEAVQSRAPREIAALTRGRYTPVLDPRELPRIFAQLDLAELAELRVRNRTTGAAAAELQVEADGRFSALVPVAPGVNTLEVYARSRAGDERIQHLRVRYGVQLLDGPQAGARDRLLRLRALRQAREGVRERQLRIEAAP